MNTHIRNSFTAAILTIPMILGSASPSAAADNFAYPPTLPDGSIRISTQDNPLGTPSYSYYNCTDLRGGKKLTVEFLGRLDNGFHALEGQDIYRMNANDREIALQKSAKRFSNSKQAQSHLTFMRGQLAAFDALEDPTVARNFLLKLKVPATKWNNLEDENLTEMAQKFFLWSKLSSVHKITRDMFKGIIDSCQP